VNPVKYLFPVNRWLEPMFAAIILGSIIYAIWHLVTLAWLPQPFFYEPADMWGDWFNTSYWSRDPGTYDTYKTVYPPLSFVFLRLLTLDKCYPIANSAGDVGPGLAARSCDWLGVAALHTLFVINIIVVALAFVKHDRKTAPWRSFAVAAGFPALEALDRGNLIIPTLTLVVVAYGPLTRSTWLRWLAIGLAVNLKVYVIASIIPQLLRRRWRWVEGALISVVAIYLAAYSILGVGTPAELVQNLSAFADSGASNLLDVWFPATFLALQALLGNWQSPLMGLIGSYWVDFLLILLPALQHTVQAAIVMAAVLAWTRPEAVSRYRLTNLGISLALITSESGGYSVILTFFFTMLEPWKGFGRKWAIVAVYLLCIPLDIPIDRAPELVRDTFFPARTVITDYKIMIGPFIRPLFFYSIPFALSLVTMREVWDDYRNRGTTNRWRFRRDAWLFPGIKEPVRLEASPGGGPSSMKSHAS